MEIVGQLRKNKERTLSYFALSDEDLLKSYGPGKWNNKQLLHHIVDAETVLYDRIRRGIANPDQVVWGFDQDAWALNLDYMSIPLEQNKNVFISVRKMIIQLADSFYKTKGHHQVVHSNTGLKTVKDLFDKVVWHNEHHLNQIEQSLQK